MGFEVVEVAVVVPHAGAAAFSWLQPFYFVLGLLTALLAARRWANGRIARSALAGPTGAVA
jgi:hypothetical protein